MRAGLGVVSLERTKSAFLVRLTGKIGLDRTKSALLVRSTAETVRRLFVFRQITEQGYVP